MKRYHFDPSKYEKELLAIASELSLLDEIDEHSLAKVLKRYPKDRSEIFSKDHLITGIEWLIEQGKFAKENIWLISQIKMKPTRSISGVTTVTVLSKPFACPGKCIFCPNDVRMPKSYIATEPGAQRALHNHFSPFKQVYSRLKAYKNIGHPTDKIELLILGGTWSYYPLLYKIWFIYECFRAMNEFDREIDIEMNFGTENFDEVKQVIEQDPINTNLREKLGDKPYNQLIVTKEYREIFGEKYIESNEKEFTDKDEAWAKLKKAHEVNASGKTRCVGLVLETRSDVITAEEVLNMRKLGATKVQLGIQTLDDEISELNKRGETKAQVAEAFRLLRAGGFKIHGHIMPNLYGATPEKDLEVYKELFDAIDFKPDELKIYPTSIIKYTELYDLWSEGKYLPYTAEQLIDLIADCMEYTPEYCRLTRVIRDIPSTEIEDGNKTTNLREVVEYKLAKEGRKNGNIRAREIKGKDVSLVDLELDIQEYQTNGSKEYFLQYITHDRQIAGFLRLSIPDSSENPITGELNDAAIIREVHVYGPSLELKKDSEGQAQHLGLGSKLIEKAKAITLSHGYDKLAVISAIGTREYYEKRGFKLIEFFQVSAL